VPGTLPARQRLGEEEGPQMYYICAGLIPHQHDLASMVRDAWAVRRRVK
jgi:hypothetical protein